MKRCSYCAADNRDDAANCSYCGAPLGAASYPYSSGDAGARGSSSPEGASRTQPLHVRPGAGGTQPLHPVQPDPWQADPSAGYGGNAPTQAYPPAYPPANTYPQAAPYSPPPPDYSAPVYQPVQTTAAQKDPSRLWKVLLAGLGVVMLCACSLAVLTFYRASTRGSILGGALPTQVANIPPQETAAAPLPVEPSPWPTFTPEPADAAQPDPQQTPVTEKLLSPECSAALDTLQQVGDEAVTNPAAPLSAGWREEFNQALSEMKTYCGTLDSASPVPGYLAEAQRDLDQATQSFDEANRLFKEGIDERRPAKVLDAGRQVRDALKYLGEAIGALRKIGQ